MASIEERVSDLESLLQIIVTNTNVTRSIISDVFSKMNEKFGTLESEIAALHLKVDKLSGDTDTGLTEVKDGIGNLQEEINKIAAVTRYEEIVANMKLVHKSGSA